MGLSLITQVKVTSYFDSKRLQITAAQFSLYVVESAINTQYCAKSYSHMQQRTV